MTKIVINDCYGGFSLSKKACDELGIRLLEGNRMMIRDDPVLIEVVERLGKEADGAHAKLKIVEIPDDVEWTIEEYDGVEWVAEVHRTWQ